MAKKRVHDAETAIMQELKDMTTAESARATTRNSKTTYEGMLNAIGDTLSDVASSNDEQNEKDEEDDVEDTELGKLSDDDEPGWVMGTISKTVQYCLESFPQNQMRLDKLMQPGWGDAANYIRENDMMYGTVTLKVLAVVKDQIDTTTTTPSLMTLSEHMQTLDIVRGQLQMLAGTS